MLTFCRCWIVCRCYCLQANLEKGLSKKVGIYLVLSKCIFLAHCDSYAGFFKVQKFTASLLEFLVVFVAFSSLENSDDFRKGQNISRAIIIKPYNNGTSYHILRMEHHIAVSYIYMYIHK